MVYAQEQNLLRPIGSAYISKRSPEVLVDQPSKGAVVNLSKSISNPVLTGAPAGKIDTLSYRKSLGGNWNTNFGMFAGDYMVQWYQAPADLFVKQVGFTTSDNATPGTEIAIKLYKVGNGVTFNQMQRVGPSAVKQGTFRSADPTYALGYVGFEDESDNSGYIRAGSTADHIAFPYAEDIWSDAGFGLTVAPVPSTSTGPVYQFINMSDLGSEPQVLRGEMFAIVAKHNGVNFDGASDRIGFWSKATVGDPDYYGWKFYATGRTTNDSSTAYWYSREYTWDFVAVVDLVGDRPPVISNVTPLVTTLSTDARTVSATITDDNPGGSTPGGVSAAILQWSVDGGTNWTDVPMTAAGDVYSADIPGQVPGTAVTYRISATDDNSGNSVSAPINYSIFQKTKDVLFVYNSTNFSANTARRFYIGGSTNTPYIVNPVDNDIWLASYGTGEAADVMSLYNWVVQVDGSFPVQDFSAAAKAYLDGATESNKRNYFLSSQDYGCLLDPNCADLTFAAGDFHFDYMGLEKLGPQDLTFTAGVKVQLAPVAGDPLSGWVDDNNTANGVTYFYDPTYELGFTGYIDAMTPNSSGTPIFSRTNGGEVVGVRSEGANWKTAFLAFDYAANNFRSDTSLTQANDPKYAWGVEVGNQALAFLQWAGYVTGIETVNPNVPERFNLSQNYPNPFNPTTNIRFDIKSTAQVELKIYDILGTEIQTLVNSQLAPGTYNVNFDAAKLSTGVYFYTIKAGDFVSTKKMMLVK
jgi:hypothetical protein